MLNRSASLAMSTSVLKALPGKLDIKRHSPSILYLQYSLFTRFFLTKTQMTHPLFLVIHLAHVDNVLREKGNKRVI